jgi:hypothetical protein
MDKFEARLRTQGRQRDGKVQGKLPTLRAARQAVVEASTARRERSKRECVADLGRTRMAGDWEDQLATVIKSIMQSTLLCLDAQSTSLSSRWLMKPQTLCFNSPVMNLPRHRSYKRSNRTDIKKLKHMLEDYDV